MASDVVAGKAPWRQRLFTASRRLGVRASAWQRRLAAACFKISFEQAHAGAEFIAIDDFEAEQRPRWAQADGGAGALTIVVVTYRQPSALDCLLASLYCQTLQNFDVLVIHDGEDAETRAVVERFAARSGRYRYVETETRHNDWGHSLRELGIREATGRHLLITNGDNYYAPRFVEFVFEAIDRHRLDVAVWDLVHSHHGAGGLAIRCSQPFRVYPVRYMVDIATLIVRTDLARRVGFADKSHDADATYLERLLALPGEKLRVGKIQKTLTVHN